MTSASLSSGARPEQPLSSRAPVRLGDEAPPAVAPDAYTPVASSVKALHDRVSSHPLVVSSWARLQLYLPTGVAESATHAASQAQALTLTLAQPLVTRVDHKLNDAIVSIMALPANATAQVAKADELALAYVPERLKPSYEATRTRVTNAVSGAKDLTDRTVERVQQVKEERRQAAANALAQVQERVASLRALLASSSAQASQALDLHGRLADLQSKVSHAKSIASEKGEQARHLTQDILHAVTDLSAQVTHYIEYSLLSEQHRATLRAIWARLLDGVYMLKDAMHLGGSSRASSPASSRRASSAAAQAEVQGSASAAQASAAHHEHVLTEEAEVEPVDMESDSKMPSGGVSKRQSHSKREQQGAEAAAPTQPPSGKKKKKDTQAQQQLQEEQKQKIAAEDE